MRRIAEITATRSSGGLNNGPVTAKRKGSMFIPPPTETPTYDLDGNQTADARWNYAWDGENRLILAEEKVIPVAVAAGVSMPTITTRQKLEFSYDAQGRRLTKKVYEQRTENGAPGTFVLKQSLVFLYDGWNMIAEIDTTTTARLIRSYEWGLDVSGTIDGAGDVGGLLVLREHPASSNQSPASSHAPCYDGNGNVTELVNLATGGVSARYEYGAFGETISVDGDAIADANPIRFSTKYLDGETGLLYYTHRYYDAGKGRWPSRDPIEEAGGNNLYGMVGNDSVNNVDYLGLNEFGTPQNPVSPYDIAVGTTKTIANEKGLHVTDCCFWVGADGKPGSGIGNREGWLRWHLGYWGDQGFATPTVRQAFATDLVDGLGLTSSLIYGGNVQYVIKLRRNSESNYTWILDWTAFDLDKSWLKSTVGAKKCEKFTPAKISNTKEVSGDVFGASPKPTPPKPQIPNPTPKQPLP